MGNARDRIRLTLCVVASVLGLLAGGCANYRLGTGARLPFATIYIEPVGNTTQLPQARELVTTRLREAFARDGRVALVNSPAAADATLRVAITGYRRDVASPRADDTGLARKFNLVLTTTCTLRDNRAGKNLFEARPVNAEREAFTDSGQLQAEYQALPLLADTLAAKLTHAVLDVW